MYIQMRKKSTFTLWSTFMNSVSGIWAHYYMTMGEFVSIYCILDLVKRWFTYAYVRKRCIFWLKSIPNKLLIQLSVKSLLTLMYCVCYSTSKCHAVTEAMVRKFPHVLYEQNFILNGKYKSSRWIDLQSRIIILNKIYEFNFAKVLSALLGIKVFLVFLSIGQLISSIPFTY